MRDWTKPLLLVCFAVLGVGLFLLDRRVASLESELAAARSGIAGATISSNGELGAAVTIPGDAVTQNQPNSTILLQPPAITRHVDELRPEIRWHAEPVPTTPRRERRPAGEINGVPYYHIEIADAK